MLPNFIRKRPDPSPRILLLRRDPDEDLSEKELARVFRHGREARAESWRAIDKVELPPNGGSESKKGVVGG